LQTPLCRPLDAAKTDMEKIQGWRRFYLIKTITKSFDKWWHRSYAIDWAIGILVFAIIHGVTFFLEPLERFMPPNDPSIAYPKRPDIIPTSILFVASIILPWFVIGFVQWRHKSPHDFHHASLSLVMSVLLTLSVTTSLKYAAGRYRPNYDSVPDADGRMSFPSGHSSTSFAGMTFLVLYLCGKCRIYSSEESSSFAKSILVASPLTIAMFIALSRTIDYHHNYSDIIAGSMIGIAVSYFVYFMYYPPLHSKHCDMPKFHRELLPPTTVELRAVPFNLLLLLQ
jgi:membrane-associated phospholipid phosphatase